MTTQAPAFINDIQPPQAGSDKLDELKAAAQVARALAAQINDLEDRLTTAKKHLTELYQNILPSLMDAAQVDHIGIPQDGNKPAMDFRLKPFYAASIAAAWPADRKEQAFAVLEKYDALDLIKTKVEASLPKGDLELAQKLVDAATQLKIPTTLSKSVHTQTLTAWLKELVETHHTFPPQEDLEKIGGSIGRIVRPQERKA